MIMKMLAYKDTKLNVFTQPFFIDGERENSDLIEITRRMCANPEVPSVYFQYDLYLLGTYDDKLAVFNTTAPEYLCSLGDYKHLAEKEEKVDVVG